MDFQRYYTKWTADTISLKRYTLALDLTFLDVYPFYLEGIVRDIKQF